MTRLRAALRYLHPLTIASHIAYWLVVAVGDRMRG